MQLASSRNQEFDGQLLFQRFEVSGTWLTRPAGHGFEVRDIVPEKASFGKRRNGKKANKNQVFRAFLEGSGRVFAKPYILCRGGSV